MPDEPEVLGLLALVLLHDARRPARVADGDLVLLEDQDRARWDDALVQEGVATLERAWRMGRQGSYQLQAAIAATHDSAASWAETDWRRIVALYALLASIDPSPVIRLNQAVAEAMEFGPARGLARMALLAEELDGYPYFHAARADLLRRIGRDDQAQVAYLRALDLTGNTAERRFITRRMTEASIH
jgi:RNA polymerase sigma-70 factor (ECF subfamily)